MTSLKGLNQIILLKLVAFFVVIITSALGQAATIVHESVFVEYDEPLHKAAQEVIEIYPALKEELETVFHWDLNFKPKVILTTAREDFRGFSDIPQVVAFALPHENLIVIDYSKMMSDPFMFRATLKHELSHLLLHDQISAGNLPKWLDEGVSQWVSGGVSEILMGGKGPELTRADLTETLIPLRLLVKTFPREEKKRVLAYAEAKSVVEYIETTFGSRGIRAILMYLQNGEHIDKAVQMGLSVSMDTLEKEWHADLSKKITWVAYFGNHLLLILFGFGGLLTVCAFIRLLAQKKRYREKEQEEELFKKMFEGFDQQDQDSGE